MFDARASLLRFGFWSSGVSLGEPVPKHDQQLVDQLELPPGFVGLVTGINPYA
jgi:hypothetical protein